LGEWESVLELDMRLDNLMARSLFKIKIRTNKTTWKKVLSVSVNFCFLHNFVLAEYPKIKEKLSTEQKNYCNSIQNIVCCTGKKTMQINLKYRFRVFDFVSIFVLFCFVQGSLF
jgi:hypothetical protein